MTIADDNLAVVTAYLAARKEGDGSTAFDYLADDISQTLMFDMPGAASPWRGIDGIKALRKHVRRMIPNRSESATTAVHASDHSVVIETTHHGVTHKSEPYENRYCYIYEVADGKIHAIREYSDSYYAREKLLPMPED